MAWAVCEYLCLPTEYWHSLFIVISSNRHTEWKHSKAFAWLDDVHDYKLIGHVVWKRDIPYKQSS